MRGIVHAGVVTAATILSIVAANDAKSTDQQVLIGRESEIPGLSPREAGGSEMAGNTGKMTREQVRQRGPRLVLGRSFSTGALFIFTEGDKGSERYAAIAKSYSRSYLERIAKADKTPA